MEKEIYDIIKKNLPAEVGETLRGVIEQGQKDAQRVIELDRYLSERNEDLHSMHEKIQEYEKLDSRNSGLNQRELDIAKREQKATEDELRFQLKEVEKRTVDMFALVSLLVKNPRAIEFMTSSSNGNEERFDQDGGTRILQNNRTITGTKEATFTKE